MESQPNKPSKIFTDVIRKTPVKVEIRTQEALIRGTLHVHPERRMSDELNASELFLAVTDVQVTDADGERSVPFIAINKRSILWIAPDEG